MKAVNKSIFELNLSIIIMGITTLYPKLINLPPNYIILGRSIVAGIGLYFLILISKKNFYIKTDKNLLYLLISGFFLGVHWVTLFKAIQVSTVYIGIVSLYTYPIIVLFLETLILKSKISYRDILLGITTFIGILLIMPEFDLNTSFTQGVLWGVFSAVLFAFRMIFSKKILNTYSGEKTMFYQLLIVCLTLFPTIFINSTYLSKISLHYTFDIVFLGLLFTALPHTLLIRSLINLKPKTVGILSSFQPFYCVFFAIIFLNEVPSLKFVIGGAFIISSVFYKTIMSTRNPKQMSPPKEIKN